MKLNLNIIVLIVCGVIGFPSFVSGNATDNDKEVIAFSIIGTIAVEIVIAVIAFFVWKKCKAKKNRDSSKVNSDLQGHDNRAFLPNADFSAAEQGLGNYANKDFPKSTKKIHSPSHSTSPNDKSWNSLPKVQFAELNLARHGSYASLDNTINSQDPEIVSVNLQSQDFIGLGFNISGSMRDGIFVSEVHNRGPAVESGVLKVGDRILNVTISFENMVFEDALTILSYASPYPVNICVQKHKSNVAYKVNGFEMQLSHPLYRSQSLDALTRIMKESLPKRSYSELKSDNKKSFSVAKKSNFVEDISSSKLRLYTTNDVYDETKLEIPVSTQISEVVIHKPPTGTSVPLKEDVGLEETLFEKKIDMQESVKLREPYKLHILENKDLSETLESTPKHGSNGKFPLFDSDDSISKLDEQMDIHFSNCDKEFEDLKQKADEDNFDLNLELNARREPDSNSLNSESEFKALEKKIELSSNFADLFDQLTDHNKFPDLNLSFDDFPSKVTEPKEDKINGKSKNSNIFLTAEHPTNQTTEIIPAVERKDDPKPVNSFNPSSSHVSAMRIQNPPDWKYSKQDVKPSSTDSILKNNEIDGLPTLPKRVERVGEMRENCLEKSLPKPESDLKWVPSSETQQQTIGTPAFNKNDSARENADDLKVVSENKLSPVRNSDANLQASPLTSKLFLSGSNPSVESTLNNVENKAQETIPDILRESSPSNSDLVKPQGKLDSVDSLLSMTKNDVHSSLLKPELNLNGITSSPLKPKVTTEGVDSSFFKYETKTQKADPSILNPETETTRIESAILLPKIDTKDDDALSKPDAANSSFLKYKLQTEETGSSKLKTDVNINSTDRDSLEYGIKTDDITFSLLKTNELGTDKINPSILKTNSKADDTDSTTDSKDGDSNVDDTGSTLLNSEMNTDIFGLASLKPAVQTDGLPSERSELGITDNVFRVEKKILFTEPIKFHIASNKEKTKPADEKSAPEISKLEVQKEGIDQSREASSPFQTPEELKVQQRSGRLTPYKYHLKDFHLKDISLGADDLINEKSNGMQDILLDDDRSENEAEDSIRPVSITHEESSFTQAILKPNALLPKRNLDFTKDTASQQAEVSQNDSNARDKSSSEESSLESESEEQKSDVRTDQNDKAHFKMSLFKRIRQESLTTSSSDSEEDGTVVSKKSLPDNFLTQPLKFEPVEKNATVSTRSSESPSGRDYKPHSLSVDVDKHQRDLMDRETTPTPSLNLLNNDSGEEEEAEAEENHEKKDEAFFEMTEDELSTDTQSLSPKSAVTRAVSCDGGFVTSDDSDLSKPRSNSLKQEIQLPGHEDNYINWSGKRLARAESFSELPDPDRVWTGSDHTKDDKGESDSDCESNNDGVTQYDLYKPRENLTQLSHSCSSSSISSNDTKTSGERGNDSETSLEPIDLKFTLPFSESNHKTDLLRPREEDKKVVCTNYEGNGAFTVTFSAHSDTDA